MAEAKGKTKDVSEQKGLPDAPGMDEVQEKVDREEEQGFRGVEVDPTPNENYSVAGVLAGKPTPETDPEHAEQVRRELRNR
jgi:hypothetical protein